MIPTIVSRTARPTGPPMIVMIVKNVVAPEVRSRHRPVVNRRVDLLQRGVVAVHLLREIDESVARPRGEKSAGDEDRRDRQVILEALAASSKRSASRARCGPSSAPARGRGDGPPAARHRRRPRGSGT